MSKAKPYYLKIQTYLMDGGGLDPTVNVWVIRKDGAVHSGRLHGRLNVADAEELAEQLGLPVEREARPFIAIRDSIGRVTGELALPDAPEEERVQP